MFPSKKVRLKIVEPSSGPLCKCFPHKWYSLNLLKPQVVHFVHVSLANGTPFNCRKWYASQMVPTKIVEPSSGPLCPCFPRKWYALKFVNPQVVNFVLVSLANGTP